MVRVTGLEPARGCHQNLNLARLPIPPYPRWCEKRDLNPYGVNHTPLKRARLPVPPLSHLDCCLVDNANIIHDLRCLVKSFLQFFLFFFMSGNMEKY